MNESSPCLFLMFFCPQKGLLSLKWFGHWHCHQRKFQEAAKSSIKSIVMNRTAFVDLIGEIMAEIKKQLLEQYDKDVLKGYHLQMFLRRQTILQLKISPSSVGVSLWDSLYQSLLPSIHALNYLPAQIQSRLALNKANVICKFQGYVVKGTAGTALVFQIITSSTISQLPHCEDTWAVL